MPVDTHTQLLDQIQQYNAVLIAWQNDHPDPSIDDIAYQVQILEYITLLTKQFATNVDNDKYCIIRAQQQLCTHIMKPQYESGEHRTRMICHKCNYEI